MSSGERIFLLDSADGHVADLVRATALVVEHAGLPVALIGGLAVTCRLATAHRPTRDVDLVAEASADLVAEAGTAATNLLAAGIAQTVTDPAPSVRILVGTTKVEIIETERLDPSGVADIEPERSRLFVVGHRWALESATKVTVSVVDTDIEVIVPVATPSALIAMKLHSIQDRSEDPARFRCVGPLPPS